MWKLHAAPHIVSAIRATDIFAYARDKRSSNIIIVTTVCLSVCVSVSVCVCSNKIAKTAKHTTNYRQTAWDAWFRLDLQMRVFMKNAEN